MIEKNELFEERKEKVAKYIASDEYIPMKPKEMAIMLSVPKDEMDTFDEILKDLLDEGKAIESKKGKIMNPKTISCFTGTFTSHARGFGFVTVEGEPNDIFIPADSVNGAMHKDTVMCRISKRAGHGKRAEGEIIKIIKRGMIQVVGTFEKGKGFGFVVPDDKKLANDIFISKDNTKGAVTGHKVVVEITKFAEGRRNPEGKVIEILGHINDPGVDILSIIRQFELPTDFPKEVYDYVENIENEISEDEILGREDLRSIRTVTIDGEDAKDLDDAVSIEVLENGNYRLGVHIADVSHYVKENSPLDKEAYKRGTSVYLVDRVIPMIPHKLSNGICSLNPNEDRLTLSCIMDIDRKGNVVDHRVVESVIHSDKRMTYTIVNRIIEEKDEKTRQEYADFLDFFDTMEELRKILSNKRKKRGSVNFDFPEAKIILDEDGKPLDIKPYERNSATNLIEEFMLVCNETIAEDFFWQQVPFIFRNHETPDDEKIEKLTEFLRNFGYRLKGTGKDELHPKSIQNIISEVEGKPEEHIISRVVLRSMKQARYMAENTGHFGLAAKYYCHFTSPIRRYPDLEIHRIIKEVINGGLSPKREKNLNKKMPDIAKQCSVRERVAEEAERETDKLKMVEFMEDKVGCVYEGVISGVTSWGVYVELNNTVEGMVSVNYIDDDFYIFDDRNMRLVGERTQKTYALGQKVFVQVFKVDKELRNIDFVFVDEPDVVDVV